ncbi:MAG: primosomal protein N' [Bacillota bacterium]|jgi:primosomal protein N' (replication factor Y)|nr:primosomal protein N' [Bacillota bacterium]NLL27077.1 primosomal protein N' [Erysipelotrichia bacterium]
MKKVSIVNVYIEHPIMQLNNTFSYFHQSKKRIERGIRVRVDFNGQKIVGFVDSAFEVDDLETYQTKLGYNIKPIEEIIDEEPIINDELYNLGLWMSRQTISPVISCFQAMLPSTLKPVSSAKKAVMENWVVIKNDEVKEIYGFEETELLLKDFKKKVNDYRYRKLKDSGCIEIVKREKKAEIEQFKVYEAPYNLTEEQEKAIDIINNSTNNTILLHGLTGSGKTEIYLQLAKQACFKKKQVLILVPEISLTSQMVNRFKSRFNGVAIYHSGLSAQEKYQQYTLVKEGKVKIVVGTRSAIFMPFKDIGLIVLDEEHDGSYKQDSTPKYNTRDIAIKRSETHNCKLILGSATPTLESYARAIKDVYQLVTLDKRINQDLPRSYLIDMSKEVRKGNYIISGPLLKAIAERLDKKQQVILLLNRRGYTPIVKCSNCAYVVMCPHCDVALSYHKDDDRLVCHVCGHSQSNDVTCPKCKSKMWRNYGVGTQRLTEEIQKKFPEARLVRMDADSTRKKDAHSKILSSFEKQKYDILIGTQMISKGLDFPNVTLVGIFNADGPLHRTDYRSVETTFDLIVQASGRSGRSSNPGEVYVQSYDINHYGIRLAVRQDYITFFNNEMSYRHAAKYPPYTFMAAILFAGKDDETVKDKAFDGSDYFRKDQTVRVLGPSRLLKIKGEYRYRIIIKSKDKQQLIEKLWSWYEIQSINKRQVSVQIDVDPYILD